MLTDEVQNADGAPMDLQDVFPEGLSLRVLNTTRRYSDPMTSEHERKAWTVCLN